MSLLKVQIVKCDENVSIHKRMRGCLEIGDLEEAYRLLQVLEESNLATLSDFQYEISDGINIIQMVAQLSDHLKREKLEIEDEMEVLRQNQFPRAASPQKRERLTSNNKAGPD